MVSITLLGAVSIEVSLGTSNNLDDCTNSNTVYVWNADAPINAPAAWCAMRVIILAPTNATILQIAVVRGNAETLFYRIKDGYVWRSWVKIGENAQ